MQGFLYTYILDPADKDTERVRSHCLVMARYVPVVGERACATAHGTGTEPMSSELDGWFLRGSWYLRYIRLQL